MADGIIQTSGITASNTYDAGGGVPASYGNSVLDILQNGINLYSQYRTEQLNMDYKRWEAMNGLATQQGQDSAVSVSVPGGNFSLSPMMLLLIAGGLYLALKG